MNSISESATMKVSSGKYWYQDVQVSILSPVIGRRLYVVMGLLCTGNMYVVYIMLITDSLAKVKKKLNLMSIPGLDLLYRFSLSRWTC